MRLRYGIRQRHCCRGGESGRDRRTAGYERSSVALVCVRVISVGQNPQTGRVQAERLAVFVEYGNSDDGWTSDGGLSDAYCPETVANTAGQSRSRERGEDKEERKTKIVFPLSPRRPFACWCVHEWVCAWVSVCVSECVREWVCAWVSVCVSMCVRARMPLARTWNVDKETAAIRALARARAPRDQDIPLPPVAFEPNYAAAARLAFHRFVTKFENRPIRAPAAGPACIAPDSSRRRPAAAPFRLPRPRCGCKSCRWRCRPATARDTSCTKVPRTRWRWTANTRTSWSPAETVRVVFHSRFVCRSKTHSTVTLCRGNYVTVFKVFFIEQGGFKERVNLRCGKTSSVQSSSSMDVAWNPSDGKRYLLTFQRYVRSVLFCLKRFLTR